MKTTAFVLSCCAVGALLAGAAFGGGALYEDRWFYCSHDFRTDADIDFYRTLVSRAAKSGYNGMLFAKGLEGAFRWSDATKARFAEVKAICDAAKVEIVPILWSVGYGTMIGVDDGLAESRPAKDLPFVAKGGKAVYRADGVTLANGDFAERDLAKNRVRGWWTDDPGVESFVDADVGHAGKASIRFEADRIRNKHGHARLSQTVRDIRPGRHYRFVTHVKTDGFRPLHGALRAQVYLKGGANFSQSVRGPADADGWCRVAVTFNSGEATNATVYVGAWGAKGGRFWISDSTLEECGLTEIATRPWCTVEMRDAATGRTYREGVDFLRPARMRGPKGGSVAFALPEGSAIAEGTRLSVDAWTPSHCGPSSQWSTCMSDPKLYELFGESARGVMEVLAPKKWFLSVDEVRNGNTCPKCRARQTDMAHVFGDAIVRMHGIIKSVRPDATVYAWSDMFDPAHNCHDDYFACRGTFAGVCDLIPKDIVMSCWHRKICRESVAYFTAKGFRVQGAGYYDYDAEDTSADLAWIDVLNATPTSTGLMYTTWQGKYDLLEKFGQMMLEKGRLFRHDGLDVPRLRVHDAGGRKLQD